MERVLASADSRGPWRECGETAAMMARLNTLLGFPAFDLRKVSGSRQVARMEILILEREGPRSRTLALGLAARGHTVVLCPDVDQATQRELMQDYDLLIASLRVATESALGVIMAAQYHNPRLATILLTDGTEFPPDELFSMLTSLRCVLGRQVPVEDLLEIAEYVLGGHSGADDTAPVPENMRVPPSQEPPSRHLASALIPGIPGILGLDRLRLA